MSDTLTKPRITKTAKKGYLTKEGGKYKTWKRRWFVLKETNEGALTLLYYTNEQEKDILGSIDLKQCHGIRMLHQGKDGKNYVLQILYKKRDYFLSADSKQQLQDWLDIIEAALKTYNILTEIEQPGMMGHLVKQGKNRKNWKRRWFVLQDSVLTYYKKETDKKPLGRFTLRDCKGIQLGDDEKNKRAFTFEILTPDRIYLISASNEVERDNWMEALEDCIPEVEEIPLIDSSADFDNDDDDDEEDVEEEHSFPNRGIKRLMSMGKSTQLSQVYESPVTKQGFLVKQGGQIKNFKKRWFVLQGSLLFYLRDDKDKKPLGMINLEYCTGLRVVDDVAKRPYCFQINTPDRIYLIQAPSKEEKVEWMALIEDSVPEGQEDEDLLTVSISLSNTSQRSLEKNHDRSPEKSIDKVSIDKLSIDKLSIDEKYSEDESSEEEESEMTFEYKTKSGWLIKEGGAHKSKKKRWFVLDGTFLHYFKSEKDKVPAGSIDLKLSEGVKATEGSGNKWIFELVAKERVFVIEAETEAIRSEWISTLEEVLSQNIKPEFYEGTRVKKGFLEKKGGNNKGWKKRFFLLDGSRFKYYQDEKSVKPLGIIDLGLCRGIRKIPSLKAHRQNMFEIITVHRTYCLSAENDLEYSNWIYALADGVPDWDPQPSKPRRTVSTFTTLEDMNIAKNGVLFKLDDFSTKWHRRWFVLKNETLYYYREEQDQAPLNQIEMGKCISIQESPSKLFDRDNVLTIHLNGRVIVLSSTDLEDMEEWIDVLGDSVPEDAELPQFTEQEDELPLIEGYLTKQGGSRKTWKRRWFVFKASLNVILYYRDKRDRLRENAALGVIPLRALTDIGTSIKDSLPLETPNGFAIITPERTFYLGADTPQARTQWVDALKSYITSKAD